MKTIIQLEELGMLVLSIFLFNLLPFEWWWFFVLFLSPDISMLGYIAGNKVGAILYNIFHHKGIGIALYISGFALDNDVLKLAGLILFGHASFDRMMGYGLKTFEGFKSTHLGTIGKAE
jgi:hypothetical protein